MIEIRAASADSADALTAPIGMRAALSRGLTKLFSSSGRQLSFAAGDGIGGRKELDSNIILIHSGSVKVINTLIDGRQQIVDFLNGGDLLIRARSHEAGQRAAVALSPVRAYELGLHELLQMLAERDDLRRDFFACLVGAIERKSGHVATLGRKRSEERVASFLLDLRERDSRALRKDGVLRLPMYRSEIADYLGLTTETVSRVFSALRDEGLIRLAASNEVVIEDIRKLALVASGGASLVVK